jgi:hypothetical protein
VYIIRVEARHTACSPTRSLISLLSMASILSTTSSAINVGCFAFINDDYVASATPNLRWVLASHAPTRSTIADVNQWVGCASLLPTPSSVPHSLFNHASAREALKQQIQTFGAIRTSATIKTSKVSYKVALKHAALNKTLTAAFATNHAQGREWLSLDTNQSSDWVPTTESPMDALESEDTTATTLKEIYSKLTPQSSSVAELLVMVNHRKRLQ